MAYVYRAAERQKSTPLNPAYNALRNENRHLREQVTALREQLAGQTSEAPAAEDNTPRTGRPSATLQDFQEAFEALGAKRITPSAILERITGLTNKLAAATERADYNSAQNKTLRGKVRNLNQRLKTAAEKLKAAKQEAKEAQAKERAATQAKKHADENKTLRAELSLAKRRYTAQQKHMQKSAKVLEAAHNQLDAMAEQVRQIQLTYAESENNATRAAHLALENQALKEVMNERETGDTLLYAYRTVKYNYLLTRDLLELERRENDRLRNLRKPYKNA